MVSQFRIQNLEISYDKVISIIYSNDRSKAFIILGKFNQQQQQQNSQNIKNLTPCANILVDFNKKTANYLKLAEHNSSTYGSFTPILDNAAFLNDGNKLIGTYYYQYNVQYSTTLFNIFENDLSLSGSLPIYRDLILFSLEVNKNDNNFILTTTKDNNLFTQGNIVKLWLYGNARDLDAKSVLFKFPDEDIYQTAGIDRNQ